MLSLAAPGLPLSFSIHHSFIQFFFLFIPSFLQKFSFTISYTLQIFFKGLYTYSFHIFRFHLSFILFIRSRSIQLLRLFMFWLVTQLSNTVIFPLSSPYFYAILSSYTYFLPHKSDAPQECCNCWYPSKTTQVWPSTIKQQRWAGGACKKLGSQR